MISAQHLILNEAQKAAFRSIFKTPIPSVDDMCLVVAQFTLFHGRRKTVSDVRNEISPDILAACYQSARAQWVYGRLW